MSRIVVLATLASALLVLLAACTTGPKPAPAFPPFEFRAKPPVRFDVAHIEIEDRYRPPLKAPNVEHLFPIPLAAAAQRWAEDRFQAVGRTGTARVLIEDASATLKSLPVDKGFTGLFKREQAEELNGELSVRIEIGGLASRATGFAEAKAVGRRTIPENVSLNERDRIYYEFAKELTEKLDQSMDQAIAKYLQPLVR